MLENGWVGFFPMAVLPFGNPWHKEFVPFVLLAMQWAVERAWFGSWEELDVKPSLNEASSTHWLGFLGQVTESQSFKGLLTETYLMGIIITISTWWVIVMKAVM